MPFLRKSLDYILENPHVYDFVQSFFGRRQSQLRLVPHLKNTHHKIVLDVGAGTGQGCMILPETARYVWLDIDPKKLKGFLFRRGREAKMVLLCDLTQLGMQEKSVDVGLCIGVSHHLSETQLPSLFCELSRVVREKIVFLDALEDSKSYLRRLLWRCDQGSYPRSEQAILSMMEPWFKIEHIERYTIYHQYILCVASPRNGKT